ncbi:hypothetical protein [Chengkuizengella sediminis]|uniref:hypothetical protein n=1 Tax=Chengkuizengella sediminis TaxID=1885917 RepID=UPI00138999AD|nr:hypothetical protein [Chengkuizengella sediminis]NDI34694.1 hypothetical protein [Chengkuizengella sediminis]
MNTFIERIKQPHILLMIATLIYQGLEFYGYGVEQETFQMSVDLVTFLLLGMTVYKSEKNKLI